MSHVTRVPAFPDFIQYSLISSGEGVGAGESILFQRGELKLSSGAWRIRVTVHEKPGGDNVTTCQVVIDGVKYRLPVYNNSEHEETFNIGYREVFTVDVISDDAITADRPIFGSVLCEGWNKF